MRAQHWGHECVWFDRPRKDGSKRLAGTGIIQKIDDYEELWSKWIHWADLIWLTGNAKYLERLEMYRKMGYPIYGSNAAAAKWETDRALGQQVMKDCGLKIIPGEEFRDHESAIRYVEKAGTAFVSKPNGDIEDKSLSYVADSAADLVFMLEKWKKNPEFVKHAKERGFIIQKKIVGTEMGVGGFFGPGGWSKWWEEAFEFKKLMPGDLGPNTGEQGTLTRFVEKSKLADMVLKPITKKLHEIEFVGCVNINCIIDDAGTPWPMEFTTREGWPAKSNQVALQVEREDPVQWMLDCVNGEDTLKVKADMACISIVVTSGDYPYSHLTSKETHGFPIYGIEDAEHCHLYEAMLGEAPVQVGNTVVRMPCYLTAGDYNVVVTGVGETITGARRSALAAAKKIRMPGNKMYRIDIGKGKLVEGLPKIQKLGYATGLTY